MEVGMARMWTETRIGKLLSGNQIKSADRFRIVFQILQDALRPPNKTPEATRRPDATAAAIIDGARSGLIGMFSKTRDREVAPS